MVEVNSQNSIVYSTSLYLDIHRIFPGKQCSCDVTTEPPPYPYCAFNGSDWRFLMTFVLERVFAR